MFNSLKSEKPSWHLWTNVPIFLTLFRSTWLLKYFCVLHKSTYSYEDIKYHAAKRIVWNKCLSAPFSIWKSKTTWKPHNRILKLHSFHYSTTLDNSSNNSIAHSITAYFVSSTNFMIHLHKKNLLTKKWEIWVVEKDADVLSKVVGVLKFFYFAFVKPKTKVVQNVYRFAKKNRYDGLHIENAANLKFWMHRLVTLEPCVTIYHLESLLNLQQKKKC